MKGFVFNELQKMVIKELGADAWEDILDATPLKSSTGGFVGPETYADEDLFSLFEGVCARANRPPDELLRAFGRFLFSSLSRLHPHFLKAGTGAKGFLSTVDRVIHVEVLKLHPEAALPVFRYEDPAPDRLVMIYESPRHLCELACGLIEGVGAHFREAIHIEHPKCSKKGAPSCRLELQFQHSATAVEG